MQGTVNIIRTGCCQTWNAFWRMLGKLSCQMVQRGR